jgi:integrase
MASVWRHPKSQYWTACFRDPHGKQRRITTKETNRKRALKLAQQYEEATRVKRTLRQAQAVLDRLHEEFSGLRVQRQSFDEYAKELLKAKKPEIAPSTLAFYQTSVDKFSAFLGEKRGGLLSEIAKPDIIGFRNDLASKVGAKTVNHHIKALKMVFRRARRDGVLAEDPAEFVDPVKRAQPKEKKRPFTLDELRDLIAAADPEWRSMVIFGLYTGQRLADLATLRWNQIDLPHNELRLVTRKTGRTLLLPIAPPLRRHIGCLPIPKDKSKPIHPHACVIVERNKKSGLLSNQFADLLASAGLRVKKSHHSKNKGRAALRPVEPLSFHSLRRTATTLLHEAGVPAAVAQALIGHDSAAMHDLYVSVGRPALENAAASLPSID